MPKYDYIKIPVNNHYFDIKPYDDTFSNEKSLQSMIKKIYVSDHAHLYLNNGSSNGYNNINILSFKNHFFEDVPKLVYDVFKSDNYYYIKTGLFVGYLNIDGIKLEINTGYDDILLKRMLNVANNIFFDNSSFHSSDEIQNDSFLSMVLQYLFLTSFKNAFALGIPSAYDRIYETGYNVKGKINTNKYISDDIYKLNGVSYIFNNRVFDQDVIDVLYLAFSSIGENVINKIIENGGKYLRQLKTLYSGHLISRNKLRKICNKHSLNNPMYSKYKKVLKYAKFIIEYKGIVIDDIHETDDISGFVIDISELWELYLANLLKNKFLDYSIISQTSLSLYDSTFFSRHNFPDIIMESEGKIVIIDAKFKKMKFRNKDVDRNDLHQIHSYAGYYNIKKKGKLCLSCLVYPSIDDCPNSNNYDYLYGLKESKSIFSIEYIKIGNTFEKIVENENAFLDRIKYLSTKFDI